MHGNGGEWVPAEPLRAWLRYNRPDLGPSEIARRIDRDERLVGRWLKDQEHMALASADLVVTVALGLPYLLDQLYPPVDNRVAA